MGIQKRSFRETAKGTVRWGTGESRTICINLPDEVFRKVARIAGSNQISFSQAVRDLLDKGFMVKT